MGSRCFVDVLRETDVEVLRETDVDVLRETDKGEESPGFIEQGAR